MGREKMRTTLDSCLQCLHDRYNDPGTGLFNTADRATGGLTTTVTTENSSLASDMFVGVFRPVAGYKREKSRDPSKEDLKRHQHARQRLQKV